MADIVVAEDDPDLRELVHYLLSSRGHTVVAVDDGDEALVACRSRRPDLLVLDVSLPGRNGLDVLGELRGDPGLTEVRVLLLSGHTRPEDVERGLAAGADRYLTKPFRVQDLLDHASQLLPPDGAPPPGP